jgi:hypothetical protein
VEVLRKFMKSYEIGVTGRKYVEVYSGCLKGRETTP